MYKTISQILQKNCQIRADQLILIGVSGGPDSIFLLDILHQSGYKLIIAHLDHQLRAESKQESQSILEIASQLKIPIVVESQDVASYAKTHKLSIEQAARQVRYEFLFRQAEAHHTQAVAVGHTADDQIETVLLHLLRGSGLSGLTGMSYRSLPNPWSHTIPLIRPILGIWRKQIIEHLAATPYRTHQDMSNWDTSFMRNRIRHELIPLLEGYNLRLRENLFQMTDILKKDEQVLQKLSEKAWEDCLISEGKGCLQFKASSMIALPLAIQRRLVRAAYASLLPDLTDIEFHHIEQVVQFLENPSKSRRSELVSGLEIFAEQNSIYICDQNAELLDDHWPQVHPNTCINVTIPGEAKLNNSWMLRTTLLKNDPENLSTALSNPEPYEAWLDFDQINLPLCLRSRESGDRFQPLGLAGKTQKISDFFINHKLPARARTCWPLLTSPAGIIWVPGYQISQPARLTSQTKNILHIKLVYVSTISTAQTFN
ncbi:MAG TPA: tRNA lysidine(34) synthetase TilS [Anaerolineales bacterium]|nr:tRNA lysidine(34) synthetase TilS [Anaerolineales bacterium]